MQTQELEANAIVPTEPREAPTTSPGRGHRARDVPDTFKWRHFDTSAF